MSAESHPLLRTRDNAASVSYSELLFDLLYAFAVTQLSHFLLHHLTLIGFLQQSVLWFGIWLGWQHTAWVTNWFDPNKNSVRLLLFGLMLVGLVMTSSIPEAFGERGKIFAFSYVAMQLGRPLFVLAVLGKNHQLAANYRRILGWAGISAAFWLLGAFRENDHRLLLWALAVICDYFPPLLGFRFPFLGRSIPEKEWTVDGPHLAERSQAFVIIAFGETILMSGASLSEIEIWNWPVVLGALASFCGCLAMWWIYFDRSSEAGSEKIRAAANPGWLGLKYHAVHVLLVGSLIICAVGNELVVNEPSDPASVEAVFTLIVGPMVYLAANMLYKRMITGWLPRSHLLALGALALLILLIALNWRLNLLEINVAVTLMILGIILYDRKKSVGVGK